jgi:hypothetical protein
MVTRTFLLTCTTVSAGHRPQLQTPAERAYPHHQVTNSPKVRQFIATRPWMFVHPQTEGPRPSTSAASTVRCNSVWETTQLGRSYPGPMGHPSVILCSGGCRAFDRPHHVARVSDCSLQMTPSVHYVETSIDGYVKSAMELQDELASSPPSPACTPPPSRFSSPLSSIPSSRSPSPPPSLLTHIPKARGNSLRQYARKGRTLRRRLKRAALKAALHKQNPYYVSAIASSISRKLPQPRRLRATETAPNILPTTVGGYTAPHRPSGEVHTLSELLSNGFRLLEWDGR